MVMKSIGAVALLSLVAIADACGDHAPEHARRNIQKIYGRQLPGSSSSVSAPVSGSGSVSASASSTPSASASVSSATPSFTISLKATNPTAIPLASITVGVSSRPLLPLYTSAVPGSTPTIFASVPPLPSGRINPALYPDLDRIPDVTSPMVKQWVAEVKAAGINIPSLSLTNDGGCANNTGIVGDASRCWWTCGGCVTEDDITECDDKNHWGLTFDDGPGYYTPNLLEYLNEVDLKATFFVVGSRVVSFPEILQTQHVAGHQIAVHTWSHKALTTLTDEQIIAELGWTKKAIRDVLGVTPTHMRPPFGDIDNRVRAISLAMGLTPVMWTRYVDASTGPNGIVYNTQDFDIRQGFTAEQVVNQWETIIETVPRLTKGFITLQHDIFQEFVDVATGYFIPDALARTPKLTIEPVITCVKMPLANAYIETNDNTTNPFKAKLGGTSDTPTKTPGGAVSLSAGSIGAMLIGAGGLAVSLIAL